jgi:RsiW-degrading membrane proteinase PrsW (M82 family)
MVASRLRSMVKEHTADVIAKPSLFPLLLCFGWGAIFGAIALGLEWIFEHLTSQWEYWQKITRTLAGVAVRQLAIVAPIEEGCKLAGVVTFRWLTRRRGDGRSPAITIFIQTIAIALGFTAQENWVYLSNGVATLFDRAIGTPIHAMFSAAFGYTLAMRTRGQGGQGDKGTIQFTIHNSQFTIHIDSPLPTPHSLINAIICHALVNIFSSAWRYHPPLNFFSYLLFPFLLWLFWRMEGWWRRVQHQPPIVLVSGITPIYRYWQRGLVLFALMLGGNAIFGFFLLVRTLSPLRPAQMLAPDIFWSIVTRLVLNSIPGAIAWGIYRYLRFAANRRNLG